MAKAAEALFAPLGHGEFQRRLCFWHEPEGVPPSRLVVHVHGFAEELNKSRRMAALQARALADAGCAVLRFDLLGCGDSEGELRDATWLAWLSDTTAACEWALARCHERWPGAATPALWLWGHRSGCLLAQEAATQLQPGWNLLFWQPTPLGKTVLQQFLRLDTAAAKLGAAGSSRTTERASAKQLLAAGKTAEVAGYEITPVLAQGLEAARLQAPTDPSAARRMVWLDVSPQFEEAPAAPATQAQLDAWQHAGWKVSHRRVFGPMFWQTSEIEDAPALIGATVEALG